MLLADADEHAWAIPPVHASTTEAAAA